MSVVRFRPEAPLFDKRHVALIKNNPVDEGIERRHLKTIRWIVLTAVALPQQSDSDRRHHLYAAVAHLVERHLAKVEVASSSLVSRSITILNTGMVP